MVSSKALPAALLFALYTTTQAQNACTMDVAIPMESLMGEGSGSSTTPANSGAGSSSGSIDFDFDIDDLIDGTINEITEEILEESLNKLRRRDLSCVAGESCFSIGKVPFCVNPVNGDYHNEIEKGNIITGDYVRNDGGKGNLYSTSVGAAAPTPTDADPSPTNVTGATPTVTKSFQTVTTSKVLGFDGATSTPAASTWWSYTSTARPTVAATSSRAAQGPPAAPTSVPASANGATTMKMSFAAIAVAVVLGAIVL